jgi:hypothetical protein
MASGDSTVDAGRPAADAPLGRPPGTVRAYLAMAIVAAFLVGHVVGALLLLWDGRLEPALALLGALSVAAATVTGCYFGARQGGG